MKRASKDLVVEGIEIPKGRYYGYENGELIVECKKSGNGNMYFEMEDHYIMIAFGSKGKKMAEVLIDKDEYERVSEYTWFYHNGYIEALIDNKTVGLHRFIMNTPKDFVTDHINRNASDNRKCNLRICNQYENCRNKSKTNRNNSGFKGIHLQKNMCKWECGIRKQFKRIYLGVYNKLEDAVRVRREKEQELFGEFACDVHPLTKEEIEFCRQQDIKYGTFNWNKE